MPFSLSFEEFFAALLLNRVDDVIGWDLESELPPNPADRQRLYEAGEQSLIALGLLRTTASGGAQMEQKLLRCVTAVRSPVAVVMGVLIDPSRGHQRQVFFVSSAVVALARDKEDRFILEDLGSAASIAPRLCAMLPTYAGESGELAGMLPMASLLGATQAALNGEIDTQSQVFAADEGTTEFLDALDQTLRDLAAVLTISMTSPSTNKATRELAVIVGNQSGWLALPRPGDQTRVATVAASQLPAIIQTAIASYLTSPAA